jgi:hypothetical protein
MHRPPANAGASSPEFVSAASGLIGRACAVLAALASAGRVADAQVRVHQLYASGGAPGALYSRDFVELFNAGGAQSLAGWTLQHAAATGSTWSKAPLPSLTLQPGERLLVRFAGDASLAVGQVAALPPHDADHPAALAPSGGKLALCSSNLTLSGAQPTSAAIVDFLGYGAANWREPFAGGGAANNAPELNGAVALLRRECGGVDQNDNAFDFQLALPRPRSRALLSRDGLDFAAFASPRLVRPLDFVRIVVAPGECVASASTIVWDVSLDAAALGGPAALVLRDDGTQGDELAGDGLYSARFAVGSGVSAGEVQLGIVVGDGTRTSSGVVGLQVLSAGAAAADSCASAEVVSGPFPLSRSGVLNGATAESNPLLHASSSVSTMGARRGHWLRVLGTGGTLTADTCLSPALGGVDPPDTVLLVATSACESLSVVGFGDDQPTLCGPGVGLERRSRVSWCSNAGQEYFVWLAAFNSGPSTLAYTLTLQDDGLPCSGAVGGAQCAANAAAATSVELEAPLGPASNDGCAAAQRPELIAVGSPARALLGHSRAFGAHVDVDSYRFRAGVSDTFRATLEAPFRAQLELYDLGAGGLCPLGALLAATSLAERCASPTLAHPLVAGQWYVLVVRPQNGVDPAWLGGFEPGGDSSAYVLSTELGAAPANDTCASAPLLACGASLAGTTWGATDDSAGVPTLCAGPGAGTSGSYELEHGGVWYRVVLPGVAGADDRSVFVELDSAAFDSRLSVFDGACGSPSCVTANDDIDSSGRSLVGWRAVAGREYFVLVHGATAQQGAFTISARCELPALGDECALAPVLAGFSGAQVVSTLGATGAASSFALGGVGGMTPCLANGAATSSYFDVWRSFTAPCDGVVSFELCGALDTVLSLHSNCPAAQTPSTLACNDNGANGCAPGSALSFATTANATYQLRIAHKEGAAPGGTALLHWYYSDGDGDGAADCVDGCPDDPLKVAPGICGCGVSDVDSDGDGVANCIDGCPNDPLKLAPGVCGCGVSDVDSDGDGVANCLDGCPNDPFKLAPGICGCGVSDVDSDGDGVANCIDGCPNDPLKLAPGICGCGVSDVDSDGDGAPNCIDGCPNDPFKLAPGVCGCGVRDVDSDGDGAADCVDGCPNDPLKLSPGACGCGVLDSDLDSDGVADCADNCPGLANPNQADCDLDGLGDVCAIAAGQSLDQNLNAIPDECEFGAVIAYCTGDTSANGCTPFMGAAGAPSASASTPFTVRVQQLDGERSGLIFYGVSGPATLPFGTGVLCVAPPTQRTPVLNSGGAAGACDGAFLLDWNAFHAAHPGSLGAPFQAGDLVWTQTWWRDPAAASGTRLSKALQFTLGP